MASVPPKNWAKYRSRMMGWEGWMCASKCSACCEPVLQSTSEHWEVHFSQTSAAVHFCWLTAYLYEEQNFICVIAVTQACCEPFLQSSTEQWAMRFSQTSVAVHSCWLTAYLYEEQISIGVIAVTQACCEPFWQSSTKQWEMHFSQTSAAAVHFCWITAHLYEELFCIGAFDLHKPAVSLSCRAALNSGNCILPRPVLQCISVGSLHTCMKSKPI